MPRLFGTNGVRGIVGETLVPELALDLGQSLGTWLRSKGRTPIPGERPRVLLGTDERGSGAMLSAALAAGLLSTGCDVVEVGPAPTPAHQFAVRSRSDLAAGVIVTASHNPPPWNGIKFCRGDGREMEPELEDEIEAVYDAKSFHRAAWDEHGTMLPGEDVVTRYHAGIVKHVDVARIRAARLTVVVDTGNGAGSRSLPRLLADLGCRVVSLNAQPDGRFPAHPSEPTPENAVDLMATVPRVGARLGIIVDGDADRAIFVDEKGEYVPGDKSLAVLAAHAIRRAGGGKVCTPVSSSSCVAEMVERFGGEVHYTVVGAPKVAKAMVEVGAVFGGEENGGVIFPAHQHTRDAAMAATAMLDLLVETGRSLSSLVAEVPAKHVAKLKVEVAAGMGKQLTDRLKQRVLARELPPGLIVREVDARDGVKVYLDGGWVLVRPSGTESIVRVFAESDDPARAKVLADTFCRLLVAPRGLATP